METTTIRLRTPRRRWPLVMLAVVVGIAILFTVLSGFIIDVFWFREIGQEQVFWTTFGSQVALGLIFGLVFAGLLLVNLTIARRLRPDVIPLTPDQEVLERIRDVSDPYLRWLIPLGCVLLGLIAGIGVSGQWQTFLLWRNGSGVTFGVAEPYFDKDAGFYVFTLPWYRFVQSWLFSALVGVTVLTGIAHVLWGGIRPQAAGFANKVSPAARAHLSVLLGVIMLVKAWGYWLGRYGLLTSSRGVVEGMSYTDQKAQLPALTFLTVIAVICAVLFFANIKVRQWSLPIIAVALLGLVSILLGTAYPAFIQQFRVGPNEQQLELPYIERNIAFTRDAFALDEIQESERDVAGPLSAKQLEDNRGTVENIRLWRGIPVLAENFGALQRIRQYYDFLDVDVDRYIVDGRPRVLAIAMREIIQDQIPGAGQTWQNRHLTYTHGFGGVAARVDATTVDGQPLFTLNDLPPVGEPAMEQPRIYFGESDDVDYVVVGTETEELDFEGATETTGYAGEAGIVLDNIFKRALFAWNFRDYNLLVSSAVDSDSRILIRRDIESRVREAVPFLGFDADAYAAVVDGQPMWIWDAYVVTDAFPNSQSIDVGSATLDPRQSGRLNYLRNSVKVVVDAYDGTVTYYANLQEPITRAWSLAFPELFTDIEQAPDALKAHFRYPENLLQVQAAQFANYHVTDASAFYQQRDFWQIPADPTRSTVSGEAGLPVQPYYQLLKLPGRASESFELVLPYVPFGRSNMVGWMAASSDPADYGEVTVFRFPEGRNIEGPGQVFSRINQDPTFSGQRTLLGSGGSEILFGDLLIIPIDDSFLYVQPVYVRSAQPAAVPELKRVIVVNGSSGSISVGSSLADAIGLAVGTEPTEPTEPGEPPTGTVEEQIAQLLTSAAAHHQAAQTALAAGDLGTYQAEVEAAQADIEAAAELLGASVPPGSPTPTPAATPTASPSP